uniref:Zinc finger, CCHC-type n=1 Tax=Tanacetum cinerariifolium TaxID=118510 RepID=A0A699HDG6_TANCI|nr:hypothetical protein [Tanacetum cinerariifolium]
MGKTIGKLHALLIEYEKGLSKKAATPQVMVIQGGRIQKPNKKSLNAKAKVGNSIRNCPAYLAELIKKKKQVCTTSSSDMFLVYGGNPEAELRVDCYCDAGFEIDRDDIKSQT